MNKLTLTSIIAILVVAAAVMGVGLMPVEAAQESGHILTGASTSVPAESTLPQTGAGDAFTTIALFVVLIAVNVLYIRKFPG